MIFFLLQLTNSKLYPLAVEITMVAVRITVLERAPATSAIGIRSQLFCVLKFMA